MRILHLIYDHPQNPWVGGGGAVRVYEISRRLAEKGHEVTVLSGNFQGAEDYHEGRLRYTFIGSRNNYLFSTLTFALKAAGYVKRHSEGFDLVVEDFAPWNPIFSRLLSNRPAILHVNHREGWGILRRWPVIGLPFFIVEKYYPLLFKHMTALSEGTKRKVAKKGTVVVPAGINSEIIAEGKKEEDDFIIYVGRLSIKNKGLDILMEAMPRLKDVKLLIAGRGREEERLREMARGMDVDFLGFVDEDKKMELLRRAKLLLLPSRFEGWGIVVLEAGAVGTPAVVSDLEELSFAIDGGYALPFKKGDADDLASKITQLLDAPDRRHDMGRRAIESVRNYTWDRITEDYEKYLETVMSAES
jgi:glycosyltransferase involved in cell wall biosynthesis